MSTFAVKVVTVIVEPHPNAQALEIARVADYLAVVGKGQFRTGDTVAYLPEGAVLPISLIEEMGLTGRLAGAAHNRVKAVRLRGALSQGLCLAARPNWRLGQDVAQELGVVKFEPPVPTALAGEVYALEPHERLNFDIENIKAYPDVFSDGEEVVFTEKIHGTFMLAIGLPQRLARQTPNGHAANGCFGVSSKGLMSRHLGLKHNSANQNNLYVKTACQSALVESLPRLAQRLDAPVLLLGEVAGAGIQDLAYGQPNGKPLLRIFAIVVDGRFVDHDEVAVMAAELNVERVPVLYRGPFDVALLAQYTDGLETISGQSAHIREGLVVTPVMERSHPILGRVALKSVSAAYLLRKGGTEYN